MQKSCRKISHFSINILDLAGTFCGKFAVSQNRKEFSDNTLLSAACFNTSL